MFQRPIRLTLAVALLASAPGLAAAAGQAGQPRLILQVTVDQLRADLPYRYFDRLGEGGLRYLLTKGTAYTNAHHGHATTETIVGHTTLATGADPAVHGMVGNVWLDRATGELTYNVEDERYPILSEGAGVDRKTEIDPTQKVARSDGRSPASILVSTFGDELNLVQGGKAKVFAVSVKDRGAISMAGHSGKAFWFSKQSGQFVTSRFYYDENPAWVADLNAAGPSARYSGKSWTLMHDPATYVFGDRDDRPYETDLGGYRRVFPHPFGKLGDKLFTTLLTVSPAGDEITLDFAKALMINEGLGQDDTPDYLSVSFSSTDYVGHMFGPSSLESEDNILRLDRTLAALFAFVDERVGLDRTLIVLSGDHGAPEAPGYLRELGFEADYVSPEVFSPKRILQPVGQRYGLGDDLVVEYFPPYVYLNRVAIKARGLDQEAVEKAVAEALRGVKGVAAAVSSRALVAGRVLQSPVVDAIRRNYHPARSGDVYVVFEPNHFIAEFGGSMITSTHGSPWRYNTHVPIIFAGMDIGAGRVARPVYTVDLAPTLSQFVHAKPPSGSFGAPLYEVLQTR